MSTGQNDTATTKPDPPTGLTASRGDESVRLTWVPPSWNGGSPILRFQYHQKEGSCAYGNWTDIPNSAPGGANATGYTVSTGLSNGTTYTFQVRAVNNVDGGGPSNEASATPSEAGVLVSNVDTTGSEDGSSGFTGTIQRYGQGFTTGSESCGYTLDSIAIGYSQAPATTTVTLHVAVLGVLQVVLEVVQALGVIEVLAILVILVIAVRPRPGELALSCRPALPGVHLRFAEGLRGLVCYIGLGLSLRRDILARQHLVLRVWLLGARGPHGRLALLMRGPDRSGSLRGFLDLGVFCVGARLTAP